MAFSQHYSLRKMEKRFKFGLWPFALHVAFQIKVNSFMLKVPNFVLFFISALVSNKVSSFLQSIISVIETTKLSERFNED